ncbi:sterol desaturase family protein [Mangrovimonas spongiae]|uniref:Fatty acid hydroxylase n=1 Tax=Mangrovimonas spongiae TaxID=2494697 RepID=A0A3R9NP88_9FLAO|nr:sterol desaturase family protein [Mangrovimonas spongiae]RSK40457.1 fatty acid hydroxylase [Mangrovimonas spongiae]
MKSKVKTDYKLGEAQIFKSQFLERLTKTNAITNVFIYGLIVVALIYYAFKIVGLSFMIFLSLFVCGIIFWTLAEYVLHRFLFHWVTEHKVVQRFHFIMHGSHHEYPKDKQRLLMPPVPGILLASLLFGGFYIVFWVLGVPHLVFGFYPGFFLGYLMYSFVHRAIHVRKPPKRFKHLWHHHNLHHFQYPDKAFGVSNTFWDKVFGTMPPKQKFN